MNEEEYIKIAKEWLDKHEKIRFRIYTLFPNLVEEYIDGEKNYLIPCNSVYGPIYINITTSIKKSEEMAKYYSKIVTNQAKTI